jgi:hypothetical protein
MHTLVLRNNDASKLLIVNDLGCQILPNEDMDLLASYSSNELLESLDLSTIYPQGSITLDSSIIMTYANVVDFLTPLTRYDIIDYTYISNKDIDTDVSGKELELLTNGSDVTLHTHDQRYFTKTQLTTPGQSQIDWGNLINIPANNDTVVNGIAYVYDTVRLKWLSIAEMPLNFNSGSADGNYLKVGDASAIPGHLIPLNATITRIASVAQAGPTSKQIQIRQNSTQISLYQNNINNLVLLDNDVNVDLQSGSILQVFLPANSQPLHNITCTLYVRWRKS